MAEVADKKEETAEMEVTWAATLAPLVVIGELEIVATEPRFGVRRVCTFRREMVGTCLGLMEIQSLASF